MVPLQALMDHIALCLHFHLEVMEVLFSLVICIFFSKIRIKKHFGIHGNLRVEERFTAI